MSFKRKFLSGLVAVTIAAGTFAGSIQQSDAKKLSPAEAALIAGTAGLFIGAAIGNGHYHGHHPHHHKSSWERHVDRCYATYVTYEESTDSYHGYDGYDHYCTL